MVDEPDIAPAPAHPISSQRFSVGMTARAASVSKIWMEIWGVMNDVAISSGCDRKLEYL